jgi:hypothetical protein
MMSDKNKKKIVEKIETKKAEAEKLKSLKNAYDSMDDYNMSQKEKMLERAKNANSEEEKLKFQNEAKYYESLANDAWNNASSLSDSIANIEKSIDELEGKIDEKGVYELKKRLKKLREVDIPEIEKVFSEISTEVSKGYTSSLDPEKIKRAKASDAHNKANGTYDDYNKYKSKLDAAKREADQLETEINSKETY